jgi:hypothetical protein
MLGAAGLGEVQYPPCVFKTARQEDKSPFQDVVVVERIPSFDD